MVTVGAVGPSTTSQLWSNHYWFQRTYSVPPFIVVGPTTGKGPAAHCRATLCAVRLFGLLTFASKCPVVNARDDEAGIGLGTGIMPVHADTCSSRRVVHHQDAREQEIAGLV